VYQYSVEGEQYTSSVIRSEIFVYFNDENEARQFLRGYSPEDKVRVYYNPDNPKESVLHAQAAPVLHLVTGLRLFEPGRFALQKLTVFFRNTLSHSANASQPAVHGEVAEMQSAKQSSVERSSDPKRLRHRHPSCDKSPVH
jgi:hypothetical protein